MTEYDNKKFLEVYAPHTVSDYLRTLIPKEIQTNYRKPTEAKAYQDGVQFMINRIEEAIKELQS